MIITITQLEIKLIKYIINKYSILMSFFIIQLLLKYFMTKKSKIFRSQMVSYNLFYSLDYNININI